MFILFLFWRGERTFQILLSCFNTYGVMHMSVVLCYHVHLHFLVKFCVLNFYVCSLHKITIFSVYAYLCRVRRNAIEYMVNYDFVSFDFFH